MNTLSARRSAAIVLGTLALACAAPAQAQHWHGGGGWHGGYRGWGVGPWWGVGVGLGLGLAAASVYDDPVVYGGPVYYPAPTPVYVYPPAPVAVAATAAVPATPAAPVAAPDPIFYPRNGQSAQQTEADRQACNRWATSYPKAQSDASIFQRATLACMDGRGYTAR